MEPSLEFAALKEAVVLTVMCLVVMCMLYQPAKKMMADVKLYFAKTAKERQEDRGRARSSYADVIIMGVVIVAYVAFSYVPMGATAKLIDAVLKAPVAWGITLLCVAFAPVCFYYMIKDMIRTDRAEREARARFPQRRKSRGGLITLGVVIGACVAFSYAQPVFFPNFDVTPFIGRTLTFIEGVLLLPVYLLVALPAILTWAWPVIAIVGLFVLANALFPSKRA